MQVCTRRRIGNRSVMDQGETAKYLIVDTGRARMTSEVVFRCPEIENLGKQHVVRNYRQKRTHITPWCSFTWRQIHFHSKRGYIYIYIEEQPGSKVLLNESRARSWGAKMKTSRRTGSENWPEKLSFQKPFARKASAWNNLKLQQNLGKSSSKKQTSKNTYRYHWTLESRVNSAWQEPLTSPPLVPSTMRSWSLFPRQWLRKVKTRGRKWQDSVQWQGYQRKQMWTMNFVFSLWY